MEDRSLVQISFIRLIIKLRFPNYLYFKHIEFGSTSNLLLALFFTFFCISFLSVILAFIIVTVPYFCGREGDGMWVRARVVEKSWSDDPSLYFKCELSSSRERSSEV